MAVFMGRKEVEALREKYPVGTEIVLDWMEDSSAPMPGTHGKVRWVDDAGTIHVNWDNGSSLGLIVGEDKFHKA